MMQKHSLVSRLLACLMFVCLLLGALSACQTPTPDPTPVPDDNDSTIVGGVDMEKLMYFLKLYEEYSQFGFPEDVDLTEYLIEALMQLSPDRYDTYFNAESYGDYTDSLQGNMVGIGVLVEIPQNDDVDYILILDAFTDSGAGRAGLDTGDKVIAVGGVYVADVGYEASIAALAGEAGTTVELTYLRGEDSEPKVCNPVRGKCTRDSVYFYEKDNIGYVRITGFEAVTTQQFKHAVDTLEAAGVEGFVFDLRENGGGLLRTVGEMLAYVLPDGKIGSVNYKSNRLKDIDIYSENGKFYMGESRGYTTDALGNPLETDHQITVPIAIITDGHTASAAELFTASIAETAAMTDFVPVTVVGRTTYGKGTSQNTFNLTDDSYIKLTIATYDPPSGVNYDGVGITPDVLVPEEQMVGGNALYLIAHEDDTARVLAFTAVKS